jgi:hypothetical protein
VTVYIVCDARKGNVNETKSIEPYYIYIYKKKKKKKKKKNLKKQNSK